MTLFVDTSVWSLAFRRDSILEVPETKMLKSALSEGANVVTTGLVLQELLQGKRRVFRRDHEWHNSYEADRPPSLNDGTESDVDEAMKLASRAYPSGRGFG